MTRKSISEKANGVRFVLAATTCVLEPARRAATLDALGIFADARTMFSTCSISALAALSRQGRRSIERSLSEWKQPALQDLVLDIDGKRGGPGDARLFRVHWERLRLIAAAVGVARRSVGAGAYEALDSRGLLAKPATLEACALTLGTLHGKVLAEGQKGAARRVERLQGKLGGVFDGWPERIMDAAADLAIMRDFHANAWVDPDVDNFDNYDNLSANYVNLSSRDYKEDSPQGNQDTRLSARGPVDFDRMQPAPSEGVEILPSSLSTIAAIAGGSAKRRAAIAESLVGCQAGTIDGWLVVRTSGKAQCDELHDQWFGDLMSAAQELNYRGLLITDRTANNPQNQSGDLDHG